MVGKEEDAPRGIIKAWGEPRVLFPLWPETTSLVEWVGQGSPPSRVIRTSSGKKAVHDLSRSEGRDRWDGYESRDVRAEVPAQGGKGESYLESC